MQPFVKRPFTDAETREHSTQAGAARLNARQQAMHPPTVQWWVEYVEGIGSCVRSNLFNGLPPKEAE
jgi:hypothetical protein